MKGWFIAVNAWRATIALYAVALFIGLIGIWFPLDPEASEARYLVYLALFSSTAVLGVISIALLSNRHRDLYALALALWLGSRAQTFAERPIAADTIAVGEWIAAGLSIGMTAAFLGVLVVAVRRSNRSAAP